MIIDNFNSPNYKYPVLPKFTIEAAAMINPLYINNLKLINTTEIFNSDIILKAEKKKGIDLLESFKELEENWNGYGAPKIDGAVITNAKKILNNIFLKPDIFPTGRNSIQFEFEKKNGDYLEFEIYMDKIVCLLIQKEDSKEFTLLASQIQEKIINFYA